MEKYHGLNIQVKGLMVEVAQMQPIGSDLFEVHDATLFSIEMQECAQHVEPSTRKNTDITGQRGGE